MHSVVLERMRTSTLVPTVAIVCAFASAATLALRSCLRWLDPSRNQRAWQYPLLVLLALWFASAAWSTALYSRLRARERAGSRYLLALAPHMSLALGLMAYAWGGLGASPERFVVSDRVTNVHGESYRVLGVDSSVGREWAKRPIAVSLERTSRHGTERLRVSYGRAWNSVSGEYRLSLNRHHTVTKGVALRHGDQRIVVRPNQPVQTKQATVPSSACTIRGSIRTLACSRPRYRSDPGAPHCPSIPNGWARLPSWGSRRPRA
jgi:hypothetical protein